MAEVYSTISIPIKIKRELDRIKEEIDAKSYAEVLRYLIKLYKWYNKFYQVTIKLPDPFRVKLW